MVMTVQTNNITAAVTAVWVIFGMGAALAAPAASPQGDTIESVQKLPDWAGVWEAVNVPKGAAQYDLGLSLTSDWAKRFGEIKKLAKSGGQIPSRTVECHTMGMPGGMATPETQFEIFFTPGRVMLVDTSGWVRRIYTDGRDHADIVDTFQGDSIGHWEGGALLADTTSLDSTNEFLVGLNQGSGSHVTERMSLKDPNTLQIDTVLDAPHALTKPYAYTTLYKRHRDWMLTQYDCVFDNLDTNHAIQQ